MSSGIITTALRQAITGTGQSLYRVSKDSGVNYCSLCRFMLGKRSLHMDVADRLAEHLGLSVGKPRVVTESGPTHVCKAEVAA